MMGNSESNLGSRSNCATIVWQVFGISSAIAEPPGVSSRSAWRPIVSQLWETRDSVFDSRALQASQVLFPIFCSLTCLRSACSRAWLEVGSGHPAPQIAWASIHAVRVEKQAPGVSPGDCNRLIGGLGEERLDVRGVESA